MQIMPVIVRHTGVGVATVNLGFELTVGLSTTEEPTVGKSPTVPTLAVDMDCAHDFGLLT